METIMKPAILRKFKFFWPWQDEAEEAWLRQMALSGWHLDWTTKGGWIRTYTFIVGAPEDYIYRLDFKTSRLLDMQDAGWEYVGMQFGGYFANLGGWQYFRQKAAHGKVQEIFTDNGSKIERHKQLRFFWAGFCLFFAILTTSMLMLMTLVGIIIGSHRMPDAIELVLMAISGGGVLIEWIVFILMWVGFTRRIRQLKKKMMRPIMKSVILRKFKFFWPWQDEAEEAWLRQMALSGWHLDLSDWAVLFGIYPFAAGMPQDYIYRLDFKTSRQQDIQEYLQLYRDAGWEYVGTLVNSGWQYFRQKAASDKVLEIFTDNASKIERHKRLRFFWAGFYLFFAILTTSMLMSELVLGSLSFVKLVILAIGSVCTLIEWALFMTVWVGITRRIQQLKVL
jgi:hypothetical protein